MKTGENLWAHFYNETPFHITSSQIYSVFDGKLYRVNQATKSREIISMGNDKVQTAFATPAAFYFIKADGGGSSGNYRLMKIDSNQNISEVFNLGFSYWYTSNFVQQLENTLVIKVQSDDGYRVYQLDLSTNTTELLSTHLNVDYVTYIGFTENYLIYYVKTGTTLKLYKIQDNQSDELFTGDFIPSLISAPNYVSYLSTSYKDSICNYYKFNNITKGFSLYMTDTVPNRRFESIIPFENYYVLTSSTLNKHFKATENGGMLQMNNHEIRVKMGYASPAQNALVNPYSRSPLIAQNFPWFTFTNKSLGGELYRINSEDSLELYQDFNAGAWGAFAFVECDQFSQNELSTPLNFSFNGKDYAMLTNGNDSYYYLYEIDATGFHCKFRIVDYQSGMIFIPKEDYLYYFVRDEIEKKVKLYRVKWANMNDQQPLQKTFNDPAWSTQVIYQRTDEMCWTNAINMRALDVYANEKSETVMSFVNINYGYLYDNEISETINATKIVTNINHTIFKYDEFGKLIWSNSVGELSKWGQDQDRIVLDKNGDVHIFGTFWKKAFFDGDSIVTSGSARYYAKLDKNTGKVLHKKLLFQTNYIDDTEFFTSVVGENNSIYLAGRYYHFSQNFGDTTLISDLNQSNFLAKYDYDGNLIWIRNVHNNWNDVFGEIRKLDFNEKTNEVGVYYSQNYNSGCYDEPWQSEIIFYDSDGKETSRKGMNGRINHNAGSFIFGKDNSTLIAGNHRGQLSGGVYEFSTEKEDDCFAAASYVMNLDRNQNQFVSGQTSSQTAVAFERSLKDENYIYFIGKSAISGKLTIVRFDYSGKYQGEKELNQIPSYFRIDLSGGYFSLAMVKANNDNYLKITHSFFPFDYSYNSILTLTRFKIDDWSYPSTFANMDVKFVDENLGVYAYPNPSYDKIQFNFQDDEHKFEKFYIYDGSGRIVMEGDVPNQNFMIVSIENLELGLYHAVFEGGKSRNSIKIMKQN
jgi:hypothetical protein